MPIMKGLVVGNTITIDYEFIVNLDKYQNKEVEVIIDKPTKPKSSYRYFYGVICATLAKHVSVDVDVIRDFLCGKFLTREVQIDGEDLFLTKSLSSLTAEEYDVFIAQCELFINEKWGLLLPNHHDYFQYVSERYDDNNF